jgi:hypothetical protein
MLFLEGSKSKDDVDCVDEVDYMDWVKRLDCRLHGNRSPHTSHLVHLVHTVHLVHSVHPAFSGEAGNLTYQRMFSAAACDTQTE